MTCPRKRLRLCNQSRNKNTSSIANDSYSCVGWRQASVGTPVMSCPNSVNFTPHGNDVGLPQQHPAAKQPCRPKKLPIAIPGGHASAVFHQGNLYRFIRKE